MRPRAALVLATAVLLAAAPRASAYCRTTTEQVPADYNPVVSGCLTGTPLFWPAMPVGYQVFVGASSQVSLAEATPIVDRSFAKWPAVSCPTSDSSTGGEPPALSVEDLGPTDAPDPCDASPCPLQSDAVHAIYFRDADWPYDDAANEIALTTVTYGVEDGRIFAAVMELNSHDQTFSTTVPATNGGYSLEAVVTHEAGHFVGMAHSQDTSAIMYAFYQASAVALTDDDAAGVCAIYPQPAAPSGCSCSLARSSGDGWGAGAALVFVVTLGGYARRRASGPR